VSVAALSGLAAGVVELRSTHSALSVEAPRTAENGPSGNAVAGTLDGDTLAIGQHVTAGAAPLVVSHSGHATWTLAPNGEAHLESSGDVIHVALDRGELSARVTKSKLPESFAVRVERMQVAAHGTAFVVERLPSTVRVEVTEGVVGVGPVGGKEFELFAPSGATVTWDGVRDDAASGIPPHPTNGMVGSTATVRAKPGVPTAGSAETLHAGTNGVEDVVRTVQGCFAEHTVSGGDLKVTVSTRMSLHVRADGSVTDVTFNPPLAEAVRDCVDREAASLEFPPSATENSFTRVLELDR
jgi:hypothetical protein